jgi:hypothetical protein
MLDWSQFGWISRMTKDERIELRRFLGSYLVLSFTFLRSSLLSTLSVRSCLLSGRMHIQSDLVLVCY